MEVRPTLPQPPGSALRRRPDAPGAREEWVTGGGRLIRGDALAVLPGLHRESFDLIFADPPFNLGKAYGASVDDDRARDAYLDWCRSWLDQLVRLLAPGGSLFVYNLPKWNVHIATYLEKRLTFRHWIAVDMKYSLPIRGRLYPAHYSLLYFCKGPRPTTFNPPGLPIVTCRSCGNEVKDYGGKKAKLDPGGMTLSDVWDDLSPVRHRRFKKRIKGLNELPVKMLDRIVDIASKPGDRVLDPFAGSGSALVVAELKRRKWVGIEIEDVSTIVERFRDIDKDRAVLDEIERSKNRLFTDAALRLREKNGRKPGKYRILDSQRALLHLQENGHLPDVDQAPLPFAAEERAPGG